MTFGEWFKIFYDIYCENVLTYGCCVEYDIINRKHYESIHAMNLDVIKPLHIQQCMKTSLDYSVSRQRKVYFLLKRVFREAIVNGYASNNPVSKIKPPRKVRKHVDIFTSEQIQNLFDRETQTSRMLLLGLWTGLRRGELLALHWDNIHSDYIRVCQTIVSTKEGEQLRNSTKTNRDRLIPLCDESKRILNDIKRLDNSDGFLFCAEGSDKPISFRTYHDRYKAFFREQQKRHSNLVYLTPHKLRHTYASYMLQNGADIETVKMLLGHTDIATTSLYVHSSYNQMFKAVQQLKF